MGRPAHAIARAIRRVEADCARTGTPPVPLAALCDLAGCGVHKLLRWAIDGQKGVYLDVIRLRQTGQWVSTPAALTRFLHDLAAQDDAATRPATLTRRQTHRP